MSSLAFHHVAISCGNLKTTEAFYTKHFGFRRARAIPLGGGNEIVFLKNGAGATSSSSRPRVNAHRRRSPAMARTTLACATSRSRSTTSTRSSPRWEADAKVTLGPLSFDAFIPGWRTAWVADPDGNIVEISQGFVDQEPV